MQINLVYDSSTSSAPAGFLTAMAAAAQYLDSLIANNITVNIQVGWGEVGGQSLGGALGEGGGNGIILPYAQLKADLLAHSNSAADASAYANLPATDPSDGAGILVSVAQEKAWGLVAANATGTDGVVGFSSSANWDFSTNNTTVAGEYNFFSDALHELTHALGRYSGLNAGLPFTVMDLFQYAAPGAIQTQVGGASYFSINGGATNLANFATTSDLGDWSNTVPNDSFDAVLSAGTVNPVSSIDITLMNVLGFSVNSPTLSGTFPFTSNADLTEALYIGYFGRAGDPVGDAYWLNQLNSGNISVSGAAASFSVQAESTALYPFLANPVGASQAQIVSFIDSVYQDLFNRAPDSGGLNYWQNYLSTNAGNPQAVGAFILAVVNGAQNTSLGPDQTTIADKVAIADYLTQSFTTAGINFSSPTSAAYAEAHSVISTVTSDATTVTAAEASINAWITAHPAGTAATPLVGVAASVANGLPHLN
jgi:hypothetical protein